MCHLHCRPIGHWREFPLSHFFFAFNFCSARNSLIIKPITRNSAEFPTLSRKNKFFSSFLFFLTSPTFWDRYKNTHGLQEFNRALSNEKIQLISSASVERLTTACKRDAEKIGQLRANRLFLNINEFLQIQIRVHSVKLNRFDSSVCEKSSNLIIIRSRREITFFCSIKLHISSRNMDSSSIPPLYDAMDNVDISSPMDDSDIFQSAIQVWCSFITFLLFLFFLPSILFFPYRARFIEIRFALGRSEWFIRSSSVCSGWIFRAFFYTIPCLSVVRVVAILFRALIFGVSCEVNRKFLSICWLTK